MGIRQESFENGGSVLRIRHERLENGDTVSGIEQERFEYGSIILVSFVVPDLHQLAWLSPSELDVTPNATSTIESAYQTPRHKQIPKQAHFYLHMVNLF